jgi:hypothetical protein
MHTACTWARSWHSSKVDQQSFPQPIRQYELLARPELTVVARGLESSKDLKSMIHVLSQSDKNVQAKRMNTNCHGAHDPERPNPSFEATCNGMAPRGAVVYSAPRGAMPLHAPQLQR